MVMHEQAIVLFALVITAFLILVAAFLLETRRCRACSARFHMLANLLSVLASVLLREIFTTIGANQDTGQGERLSYEPLKSAIEEELVCLQKTERVALFASFDSAHYRDKQIG